MQPIQVGIIGNGFSTRVFHAPVISAVPDLHFKSVVERGEPKLQAHFPKAQSLPTVEALLQDPTIQLVVVATPNHSHFELAKLALQAGKHVVVEKPFTSNSAQASALVELAQAQDRLLSVYHNRRWDGDFLTIQKLLNAQLLGRLVEYEAHFDRFRPQVRPQAWREQAGADTGILFDLGSHLIDQALVLFGLPDAVGADIRIQRDNGATDDNFEVRLHYPALKVTLKGSMLVRESLPRFILHGTQGSFVKYGLDPQENALRAGSSPTASEWGKEDPQQWGRLNSEINGLHFSGQVETLAGSYQSFYQNIADAIRGRAELAVTARQAQAVIRIIELALKSQHQQCLLPFRE